jgi:hypothetical protein
MRAMIFFLILACATTLGKTAQAQAVPFNLVKQWELLPDESLASLTARPGIAVVGTDLSRLDPGMVVNVVYLQANVDPRGMYRCVEYTREWQMETIQTNCYAAVTPVRNR